MDCDLDGRKALRRGGAGRGPRRGRAAGFRGQASAASDRVLVGNDPGSETYVRHKHSDAEKVGITSADHRLPETATTAEVVDLICRLNADLAGINPVDGRLRGDVEPAVAEKAGWMTPVPGGVGPMTRAMLMWNTLKAEQQRRP